MKRKFTKMVVLFLVTALLLSISGCAQNAETKASSESPSNGDTPETAITDIKLEFAKNFNVQYFSNGMKIVTDAMGNKMLLLNEGQTAPIKFDDLPTVTIPLQNTVYTSTTQVGYLRAFNDDALFDSISGVRLTADEWDFDAMKSRMLNGKIVDIGSNTAMTTTYDHEIIQSLNPNLLFLTGGGMNADIEKLVGMLDQSNIPYLIDGSSGEDDYRGTMEWIKFFAAFYNLDQEAETYFEEAMSRIDEVVAKTKDQPKPKVGWAIVAMGKAYVEDAGSKSAKMIRAAGAEYLFDGIGDDTNSVTNITIEELYELLSKGDILINRGMPKYGPDKKSITDQAPALAELEIFAQDRVWQITDNFWNSYHNIDKKYLELAAIFHPDLFPDVEFENFILMPDVAQ
ncbi:ABC transporter substrate-binding protein [Alkalibacter mobilis]|uniref:ABC transporter substrate-binding protein n=1 Tax=Alkalibacter mobilis TaxID=2787712 RepID=UPI00189D4171|nr:ABC transporter substrate-binding protein [Alkalibacter mobilis]MBF7095650.1 ABC transporter substrate-binding protein [Alkalibacter mobilis]